MITLPSGFVLPSTLLLLSAGGAGSAPADVLKVWSAYRFQTEPIRRVTLISLASSLARLQFVEQG
jgi:hypothetical protein